MVPTLRLSLKMDITLNVRPDWLSAVENEKEYCKYNMGLYPGLEDELRPSD